MTSVTTLSLLFYIISDSQADALRRGARPVRAYCLPLDPALPRAAARHFFLSFSATRPFTNFFTNLAANGLFNGNCIVPFDVRNFPNSFAFASITATLMGNKLQWSENAAYAISAPL